MAGRRSPGFLSDSARVSLGRSGSRVYVGLPVAGADEVARRKNTTKSKVRAKVEHAFRILKRIFGFDKVRYRGLAKNHNRLCACFALVNLYLHRKRLALLGA